VRSCLREVMRSDKADSRARRWSEGHRAVPL